MIEPEEKQPDLTELADAAEPYVLRALDCLTVLDAVAEPNYFSRLSAEDFARIRREGTDIALKLLDAAKEAHYLFNRTYRLSDLARNDPYAAAGILNKPKQHKPALRIVRNSERGQDAAECRNCGRSLTPDDTAGTVGGRGPYCTRCYESWCRGNDLGEFNASDDEATETVN